MCPTCIHLTFELWANVASAVYEIIHQQNITVPSYQNMTEILFSFFFLDDRSSHSCLQESSAQYHSEKSQRLPVSPTLIADSLCCCYTVSTLYPQVESDVAPPFAPDLLMSLFHPTVTPSTSTKPFSPSCSSTRWGDRLQRALKRKCSGNCEWTRSQ